MVVELRKGRRGVINNSRISMFLTETQKFGQNNSALWRCWFERFVQVEMPLISSLEHYLPNAAMCQVWVSC